MNKYQKIFFVFSIIWMSIIYFFSSQQGAESSLNNHLIVKILLSIGIDLFPIFGEYTNLVVRKIAHFSIFLILAQFYLGCFSTNSNRFKYAFILAVLYAFCDEFHQSFVPNRFGAFTDVLIDSFGALTGLIFRKLRLKSNK